MRLMKHSPSEIHVLTVGHAVLDIRFVVDRFARIDEESIIKEQSRGAGGSAVNVAIGVKRLGGVSAVMAKIGFDDFGRILIDELMKEKVDTTGIKISFGSTGFTIVIIDSQGRISMYGFKGVAEELEPDEINLDLIKRSRFIHIASLRLDTSTEAARYAKKYGKTVSWDPGRVLSRKGLEEVSKLLQYVDIVFANEEETRNLARETSIKTCARKLLEHGVKIVVVKRGAKGVYIATRNRELQIPAFKPPRILDTTGAGDSFTAGFLMGLYRGYGLYKATVYASATAALKISRLGSHEVPSHEEVARFIWEHIPDVKFS